MCKYTLHEQYCRHCQKLINSDRLQVQKCHGKVQELNAICKRIEELALIQDSPAGAASSPTKGKGKGRDLTPPPMPQSTSELQNLPCTPSPDSRVRGVKKWLQQQEQDNSPASSSARHGTCTAGASSSTAQQTTTAPSRPRKDTPMPSPFFTPQRATGTAKRKAHSIEDAPQPIDYPFYVAKRSTPPSAKRHHSTVGQAGRGSAAPGPDSGVPVLDLVVYEIDMLDDLNSPVLDNDGDSDMVIAGTVDCEMSDVDMDSFGSEIDLDGDINISDPVYEDAEQQDEVDEEDKSEEMELECIPRQVGVLVPGWGVCEACARL
ncbi:hypothetical protein V8F33_011440 [Rhypophila sp. PSN 637]